jgi:tungstate transport system substrate-binding protein
MQALYDARMLTIFTSRRRATSDAPSDRRGPRRLATSVAFIVCRRGVHRAALTLTGVAAAMAFMLVPTLASADSSSTLTVVGTSDVSDSGLMTLIGNQFSQAFPQFTFKYIGSASGAAITSAETGSQGASALIVHAPTLENQFVGNGFSYQTTGTGPSTNPFGNAIWLNDFVLAGPTADPAAVAANAGANIAQAFVDVATAGLAGKATFVSRGGTPGTTTAEHAIWADVNTAGLTPAGVTLCAVSAALGGGLTPIAPGGVPANGDACPGDVLPGSAGGGALPSWYVTTALTQGPNVIAANACTTFSKSGPDSCYVFTDRGTFDFLASGTDPASSVPNLKVLTRGPQPNTAPGGQFALINYFHAYVINPGKVPIVNVPAAQDFVNFLTSPTVQNELQNYLPTSVTGDPSGPPFVATANPSISIAAPGIPATYKAGTPVTITGGVVNKELGYPVLDGVPVAVSQVVNGLPVKVAGATATTDASGNFSLTFTPPVNGSYEVTTEAISKVEPPTLTPPFGDILSPSASAQTTVTVDAAITALKARSNGAGVAVFGTVAPGFGHVKGTVTISGRPVGSNKDYKKLATVKLAANDGNFAAAPKMDPGNWQFKAVFADTGQVTTSPAKTITFKLGTKPKTSVSRDSTKVNGQFVKVPATVKPRATSKGGVVKLLVLKATNPAKPQFNQKDKADVRKGKNTVTLKTKLSGAGHYLLELKYSSKGSTASYTTLRGVTIKSTQ